MAVAQGELMMEVQAAIKRGWEFSFEAGERKFGWVQFTAKKGEMEIEDFRGLDALLGEIHRKDFPDEGF
jgi:hypothetical protein